MLPAIFEDQILDKRQANKRKGKEKKDHDEMGIIRQDWVRRVGLTAKTCLLRIMPRQYEPLGFIGDAVSGDGWVVGNLLDEEGGRC
jgi:hypothetical protein